MAELLEIDNANDMAQVKKPRDEVRSQLKVAVQRLEKDTRSYLDEKETMFEQHQEAVKTMEHEKEQLRSTLDGRIEHLTQENALLEANQAEDETLRSADPELVAENLRLKEKVSLLELVRGNLWISGQKSI